MQCLASKPVQVTSSCTSDIWLIINFMRNFIIKSKLIPQFGKVTVVTDIYLLVCKKVVSQCMDF